MTLAGSDSVLVLALALLAAAVTYGAGYVRGWRRGWRAGELDTRQALERERLNGGG